MGVNGLYGLLNPYTCFLSVWTNSSVVVYVRVNVNIDVNVYLCGRVHMFLLLRHVSIKDPKF
jgi:hypothetical protein